MATLEEIEVKVGIAKAYYMKQLAAELLIYKKGGCGSVKKLEGLKRIIKGLTFQIRANVNDANTESLYECLLNIIAGVTGSYIPDPAVQIPGQTVIVVKQVVSANDLKIPFSTTGGLPFVLSNYHSVHYPLYGDNPSLEIFIKYDDPVNVGQFVYVEDTGTVPYITYVGDDPTQNITDITYYFPYDTVGYLSIRGVAPGSSDSGSGSGGSGVLPDLIFTQLDLRYDASVDDWYLPLILPVGRKPVFTTVDDREASPQLDLTFASPRFYGFGNNNPQTIKITIR